MRHIYLETRLDREDIKNFINTQESNIYTGVNEDSEDVIIVLERGKGMVIKTRHHSKPHWYECVEYDNLGFQVSVSYEHCGIKRGLAINE